MTGLLTAVPAYRLTAMQCPDGSPPPCATPPSRGAPAPAPNSVAVLYFDNLSRDSSYAYLADGLTEELITRLGQVRRLDVKSRHESRRVRDRHDWSPNVLGRSLNAAYVLSGSVQAVGTRLRVAAELVRTATGERVWGELLDRAGTDALDLQAAIATAVAAAVIGQLLPPERSALARHATRDPVAYDLYLRGRFLVSRFTEPEIRMGIEQFRAALARDSTFGLAHAGMSYGWLYLADNWLAPLEALSRAREAAAHALANDTTLALAHLTAGYWALQVDHDFAGAERRARRAIALDPRLAEARIMLAQILVIRGQIAAGLSESRRAWELDSLSSIVVSEHVGILVAAGRYQEALALARRAGTVDPGSRALFATHQAAALLALQECASAHETVARIPPNERSQWTLVVLGLAAACLGQTGETRTVLDSLSSLSRRTYVRPGNFAELHAAVGEIDAAFAWLERAYQARDWNILNLNLGTWRNALQADPRFAALLRRVGLPSAMVETPR